MSALGVKRTCPFALHMSAYDPKRTLVGTVHCGTAHFWTLTHPGIAMEDDVKELLKGHKELAALLLQAPEPLPA